MTSILSSISGYFSKSLILGTFLPVVIFIVAGWLFVLPLFPGGLSFLAPLEGLDAQWKVISVSFFAIVTSGLIYNLNIPILRWYEGYPWRNSWIGRRRILRHKTRFQQAQTRIDAMRACRSFMESTARDLPSVEWIPDFFDQWKALGSPWAGLEMEEHQWLKVWKPTPPETVATSVPGSPVARTPPPVPASPAEAPRPQTPAPDNLQGRWAALLESLIDEYSGYRRDLKAAFPDRRDLILPTRLGNVIRSFEFYSGREYNIDAIVLWPRLVAIIPRDYAVMVDDAKTSFDFMMNCSFLSLVMAGFTLGAALFYPAQIASFERAGPWLVKVIIFTLLSFSFYRLSIDRAAAWGSVVKSSFDLYRWELLKKLGYQQEPVTREEERRLWGEIGRQMVYGDRFDKRLQAYAIPTDAPSYPALVKGKSKPGLELTRGVKRNRDSDALTIYLRVKNTSSDVDEGQVVVTDKLPDDFDYQWQSAKIDSDEVPVTGSNPYQFVIGDLPPASERVLTYNAVPRKRTPS